MAKRKAQGMLRLGDNAKWDEVVTYEVRLSQTDCNTLGVPFTLQGSKGVVRGPADGATTMFMTGLALTNDLIHSALSQMGTPSGAKTRISKHVLLRLYARDKDIICKDEYRLLEWVSVFEDWPEIKQFEFSESRGKYRVEAVKSFAKNPDITLSDSDFSDSDGDDVCSNALPLPPAHILRCLTRFIAVVAAGTGYTDTAMREDVLQHLRERLFCGYTEAWMHLGMDGRYLVECRKHTPSMCLPWHEYPESDEDAEAERDEESASKSERECPKMNDDGATATTGEAKEEPAVMVRMSKTDCTRYDVPYKLRNRSHAPDTIYDDFSDAVAISSAFLLNAFSVLPPLDKSNLAEVLQREQLEMDYTPGMTKAEIRASITTRKTSVEYTKYMSKAELLSLFTAEGITADELQMMEWARTYADNPSVTHFRFEGCAAVGKFFVRPMDGEHIAYANPADYGPMPPSVICRSTASLCELLRTSSETSETTKQVCSIGYRKGDLIVSE
jgi:hypothetical protein